LPRIAGVPGAAIDEPRIRRCAREVRSAVIAGVPTFAIRLAAEAAHVFTICTNRNSEDQRNNTETHSHSPIVVDY
jgi:hypothetical protein